MNSQPKFQCLKLSAKCFINALLNAPLVCAPEISTRPANSSDVLSLQILNPVLWPSTLAATHRPDHDAFLLVHVPLYADHKSLAKSKIRAPSSSDCTAAAAALAAQPEPH